MGATQKFILSFTCALSSVVPDMKLEIDGEDLAVIGGVIILALLIISLASCDQMVEARLKERIKQDQSK